MKNTSDLQTIRTRLPLLANVIVVSDSGEYPLINDSTTFYVCKDHVCHAPTNDIDWYK